MRVRHARPLALAACVAVAFLTFGAEASFHTFQINEVYSSPDGSIQFVELREAFGLSGQQFLSGHTLTSTQGSITRVFTFPNNLPTSSTQNRFVLIATPGFAAAAGVTPDYTVPAPFLFPGGGTVDYAGVDQVTYPALPADGRSSVGRSGVAAPATPTNFAGQTGTLAPPPPPAAIAPGVPAWSPLTGALTILSLAACAGLSLRRRARVLTRAAVVRPRRPSSPTPFP